ncbi:unnamed protein product [Medioppia subpectinata]|uniref:Copper type II ascorbate-dependent monooxygenase C-terminal domain-containing protein n=1 Tax=Medioppia subpectinata TaxID=1979941 RepID=A0A7R9KFU2_9ACAR|nr:unnamed protein product [Medioppia subpectinata]CAG2102774.1 unnamed protein product [Medioppia subpectinata]
MIFIITICTALPPHGITVFAQQFHTHQRRTRVRTQHVRQGRELSLVNRDEHCNFEYLDTLIMPLVEKSVAPDIMCSTFLHYYPAVNLKWVINDMHTYIDFMAHHMSYSEQELHDYRPPMAERCDQLSGDSYSLYQDFDHCNETHTKQAIDYVEKYIENPVRLSLILSVAIILLFIIIFLSFQCLTRAERRAEALYAYRKVYTKRDLNFEKFPNFLAEEKIFVQTVVNKYFIIASKFDDYVNGVYDKSKQIWVIIARVVLLVVGLRYAVSAMVNTPEMRVFVSDSNYMLANPGLYRPQLRVHSTRYRVLVNMCIRMDRSVFKEPSSVQALNPHFLPSLYNHILST